MNLIKLLLEDSSPPVLSRKHYVEHSILGHDEENLSRNSKGIISRTSVTFNFILCTVLFNVTVPECNSTT